MRTTWPTGHRDSPVDVLHRLRARFAPWARMWGAESGVDEVPERVARGLYEFDSDLDDATESVEEWTEETFRDKLEVRHDVHYYFGPRIVPGYIAHRVKRDNVSTGAIVELEGELEDLFRFFPDHASGKATLRMTLGQLLEEFDKQGRMRDIPILNTFRVTFVRKLRGETREESKERERRASEPVESAEETDGGDEEGGAE